VPLALTALDPLPWLGLSQVEQMRMAPAHLAFQLIGHGSGSEVTLLFGDDELKRQVEQQIAQLSPDLTDIAFTESVIQLQDFLDQVWSQCFTGLGPIPGTSFPEVPNHRHGAPKR
jgi:hypothetical protein